MQRKSCNRAGAEENRAGMIAFVLLAAAMVPAMLSGCGSTGRKLPVRIIAVEASGGMGGSGLDSAELRELLERALEGSKHFRVASQKEKSAYRVKLKVMWADEQPSERDPSVYYRGLQVELQMRGSGESGLDDEISATGRAFEGQDPAETERGRGFSSLAEKAVRRAVHWVEFQLEARKMPPERIVQILNDEDERKRFYMLRALREQNLPQLLPAVLKLLGDDDTEVRMEAIGALVAIGDERAVGPLIRLALDGRDSLLMSQVVTAVGELGGDLAKGFLFTVAAGYGAESVRQQAEQALGKLESRKLRRAPPGTAMNLKGEGK